MSKGRWWTNKEMKMLIESRSDGKKFNSIAKEMGRTTNAVISAWNHRNRYIRYDWTKIKEVVRGTKTGD